MSAPTSHDPVAVNTADGTAWLRRAVTVDGRALYAMDGAVMGAPEFVMATLADLAERGITGSTDALPMPIGPASREPRPIAYASKRTEAQLLLADRAERQRAAEWPWDMWCRRCLVNVTSHRTEADALEAADQHVKLYHAPQAEVHRLMTAGGFVELERLRARVAELEAELGRQPKKPLDPRACSACGSLPESWCPDCAACEQGCFGGFEGNACGHANARWRGTSMSVEESADKLTALLAPTQVLREEEPPLRGRALLDELTVERAEQAHNRRLGIEDSHDSPLHHDYRLGRELPQAGGES